MGFVIHVFVCNCYNSVSVRITLMTIERWFISCLDCKGKCTINKDKSGRSRWLEPRA